MSRLPRKSIAALIPVAFFAGAIAMRVGHDEPRLVRTAGTSAPLVESSTTSTSMAPAETAKVAELDATVDNHETRIRVLESTTTTTTTASAVTAAPVASSPVAPAVEAQPTTTTTIVSTTSTTQAAPTTTTTIYGEPWWCSVPSESGVGGRKVPCDSTTTTTSAS